LRFRTFFIEGRIYVYAHLTAFSFYQKAGFTIVSQKWLKEGIEYVKMENGL
jgi:predicted GNAT family N-acyltransferase